jgi:hypothetical protein
MTDKRHIEPGWRSNIFVTMGKRSRYNSLIIDEDAHTYTVDITEDQCIHGDLDFDHGTFRMFNWMPGDGFPRAIKWRSFIIESTGEVNYMFHQDFSWATQRKLN